MKKNYSYLIKDKKNRTLTAKGYKFLYRCIDTKRVNPVSQRNKAYKRTIKDYFNAFNC